MTKRKDDGRCTGHCCHSVVIALSPKELQEMAALPKGDLGRRIDDIDILADMLIYHGQFPTNPISKTWSESWSTKALRMGMLADMKEEDKETQTSHFYGCRHVKLNGDCGIYENRPKLCRTYPDGRLCDFQDCTMSLENQVAQVEPAPWKLRQVKAEIERRGLVPPKSLLKKLKAHDKKNEGMLLSGKEQLCSVDIAQKPTMRLRVSK